MASYDRNKQRQNKQHKIKSLSTQSELLDCYIAFQIPQFYQRMVISHINSIPKDLLETYLEEEIKSISQNTSYIQSFMKKSAQKTSIESFLRLMLKTKIKNNEHNQQIEKFCEHIARLRKVNFKMVYFLCKIRQKYDVGNKSNTDRHFYCDFSTNLNQFSNELIRSDVTNYLEWQQEYDPFYLFLKPKINQNTQSSKQDLDKLMCFSIDQSYSLLKMQKIAQNWICEEHCRERKEKSLERVYLPQIRSHMNRKPTKVEKVFIEDQRQEELFKEVANDKDMNKTKYNKGFMNEVNRKRNSNIILQKKMSRAEQRQDKSKSLAYLNNRNKPESYSQPINFVGRIKRKQQRCQTNPHTDFNADETDRQKIYPSRSLSIRNTGSQTFNIRQRKFNILSPLVRKNQSLFNHNQMSNQQKTPQKQRNYTPKLEKNLINIQIIPFIVPHHNKQQNNKITNESDDETDRKKNKKDQINKNKEQQIQLNINKSENKSKNSELLQNGRNQQQGKQQKVNDVKNERKEQINNLNHYNAKRRSLSYLTEQQQKKQSSSKKPPAPQQRPQQARSGSPSNVKNEQEQPESYSNSRVRSSNVQPEQFIQSKSSLTSSPSYYQQKQATNKSSHLQNYQNPNKHQHHQQQLQHKEVSQSDQSSSQQRQSHQSSYEQQSSHSQVVVNDRKTPSQYNNQEIKPQTVPSQQNQQIRSSTPSLNNRINNSTNKQSTKVKNEPQKVSKQQQRYPQSVASSHINRSNNVNQSNQVHQSKISKIAQENKSEKPLLNSLAVNPAKTEVKLKIGKFTSQALTKYLQNFPVHEEYSKYFDINKTIIETQYEQTYFCEFSINDKPGVIALSSLTQNNNFVIRFWALSKFCQMKVAEPLFKKYCALIQKYATNDQFFFRGPNLNEMVLAGFKPFKQNIYVKKRVTKARQIQSEFEQYFSIMASHIAVYQEQIPPYFHSNQIQAFSLQYSKIDKNILTNQLPQPLRPLFTIRRGIQSFSSMNKILSDEGYDGYAATSKMETKGIDLSMLNVLSQFKELFIACNNKFKLFGNVVLKQSDKMICSIKLSKHNGRLCFAKGYKNCSDVAKSLRADSGQKIEFIVPMFNKLLYGQYKQNIGQKRIYANLDISLFWEDQMQGVVKFDFEGYERFDQDTFYVAIELQGYLCYIFTVKKDDFIQ